MSGVRGCRCASPSCSVFATSWATRFTRAIVGSRLVERWVGQHHRGLDLAVRDPPIRLQQRVLLLGRDELEAMTAVEADRPVGGGPGADEDAPVGQAAQMHE